MLQLTFYALLVLLVIWITGRAHSALLALGAVFVVGFFPLASVPVLPAYVNSLSYAVGGWHPVLTGTAVLVVSIVVTLATIGCVSVTVFPAFFISRILRLASGRGR